MNFNKHSEYSGLHAFLGASTYSWLNYDEEKLRARYTNHLAAIRGTELHEFAATCIRLGQKLPKSTKTLNRYVNDAIGYKMTPEQILFYSPNCFGTADAIRFKRMDGEKHELRIHDYKSGVTPAKMEQLMIYAALFCLEYNYKPSELDIYLRLYQNDDYIEYRPEADEIGPIMDKIVTFDKIIRKIQREELGE